MIKKIIKVTHLYEVLDGSGLIVSHFHINREINTILKSSYTYYTSIKDNFGTEFDTFQELKDYLNENKNR